MMFLRPDLAFVVKQHSQTLLPSGSLSNSVRALLLFWFSGHCSLAEQRCIALPGAFGMDSRGSEASEGKTCGKLLLENLNIKTHTRNKSKILIRIGIFVSLKVLNVMIHQIHQFEREEELKSSTSFKMEVYKTLLKRCQTCMSNNTDIKCDMNNEKDAASK